FFGRADRHGGAVAQHHRALAIADLGDDEDGRRIDARHQRRRHHHGDAASGSSGDRLSHRCSLSPYRRSKKYLAMPFSGTCTVYVIAPPGAFTVISWGPAGHVFGLALVLPQGCPSMRSSAGGLDSRTTWPSGRVDVSVIVTL